MATEKTTAIVLRTIEFSETSSVVTLFSRDFGKLGGLAKGSRRPKGPFESALDLLALVRIVLIRKSSESLDLLTEAKLEKRFRGADRGLANLYAGYYLAELLNELTDVGDPHPELFAVAEQALAALGSSNAVARIVLWFELAALRLLGHLPAFDHCAECGAAIPASGRAPFGLLDGGALCADCRPGRRQIVQVRVEILRMLAAMSAPEADWQTSPLTAGTWGELRGMWQLYIAHLLGRKPRLFDYLGGIAESLA